MKKYFQFFFPLPNLILLFQKLQSFSGWGGAGREGVGFAIPLIWIFHHNYVGIMRKIPIITMHEKIPNLKKIGTKSKIWHWKKNDPTLINFFQNQDLNWSFGHKKLVVLKFLLTFFFTNLRMRNGEVFFKFPNSKTSFVQFSSLEIEKLSLKCRFDDQSLFEISKIFRRSSNTICEERGRVIRRKEMELLILFWLFQPYFYTGRWPSLEHLEMNFRTWKIR